MKKKSRISKERSRARGSDCRRDTAVFFGGREQNVTGFCYRSALFGVPLESLAAPQGFEPRYADPDSSSPLILKDNSYRSLQIFQRHTLTVT